VLDNCKRNWHKRDVFQDVEDTECRVIESGLVTQAVLSRISEGEEYPVLPERECVLFHQCHDYRSPGTREEWNRCFIAARQASDNQSPAAFAVYGEDTHTIISLTE